MYQSIDRFVDAVTRLLSGASRALVMALIILINVEVVMRYFLDTSTLIVDEYGGYALVWICMLGFGQALRSGQFIAVDAFSSRLPAAGQRLSAIAGGIVGLCVSVLLAYTTFHFAATSFRFGTVSIQPSATPLWIPQSVLPIGFGWLCVIYIQLIVREIFRARGNEDLAE